MTFFLLSAKALWRMRYIPLIPLQRGNLTEGFPPFFFEGGGAGGCYSSKLELLTLEFILDFSNIF